MRRLSLLAFAVGSLAIASGIAGDARADKSSKRPYQYVSLDAALPEGFLFFDPRAITDSGRIYGTLFQCGPETCSPTVAVYQSGEMTALHDDAFANTASNFGGIGGGVVLDPDQFTSQAALFTRREVELIPPLSAEVTSQVLLLANSGTAFVESFDSSFDVTHYLTRRGHDTPLNFGPDPAGQFDLNWRGVISGTSFRSSGSRAFRYDPFAGSFTLLEPLPTEPESWGQAINSRGDVLGYSFEFGGLERIGIWRGTEFRTYFVEGTPEFPTVSNRLLWNEWGLIVITDTTDLSSYLVPRPGVRLNLADLTEGPLPPWTLIVDINNRGDLIGVGGEARSDISSTFLLRRMGRLDGKDGALDSVSALALSRRAAVLERVRDERLHAWLANGLTAHRKDLPDR